MPRVRIITRSDSAPPYKAEMGGENIAQAGRPLYFPSDKCAFCGGPHTGEYSVHRDGFGIGPEVPLCNKCGSTESPTLPEIWAKISHAN